MSKRAQMNFEGLVDAIRAVDQSLSSYACQAVNISLTLRNWLIGLQIAEFELRGADKAKYGEQLLSELAERLASLKISNCNRRQLYDYLNFYRAYPQIAGTVSAQLETLLPEHIKGEARKVPTLSAQLTIPPDKLINSLSYSKFKLLVDLDDPLKRAFYEIECILGNWSVRELKRQIATLYFERSGLSRNKKKLAEMVQSGVEKAEPKLAIRDPYIFEFLGIK